MSTMPSVGSGTYSPGPNMVCSPEQEKVGTGSIEAIIYPVYSDLRTRATVSYKATFHGATFHGTPAGASQQPASAHPALPGAHPRRTGAPEARPAGHGPDGGRVTGRQRGWGC